MALLGRAKAPFSRASIPPRRIASRVPAESCAHRDALLRAFIEPPICDRAPFLFRWSLDMMQAGTRWRGVIASPVGPCSRFSARRPGLRVRPQGAKRGTIRTVVPDMRPKTAANGSRWQFFGRGSRLAPHATMPPTCGELLGDASEPDPSPAGPGRDSRVGCAPCHSDQTSRPE
jgi:hypothetical protein